MKDKVILLSYYGAKNRIAGRYPEPKHETIVEPFAGSAGYACRYPDRKVILVEKDPVVFGAVDFLIRSSPEDIMSLPLLEAGQKLSEMPLPRCAKYFISFWTNKGTARGSNVMSQWSQKWPDNSFYWGPRCRERAAYAAARIKHWQIICGDYTDAPDVEATWFIDPPYAQTGRYYAHNQIDYTALSQWCLSRRGQTIVCENEGATWLPFEHLCSLSGAAKAGRARKRSTEVMWTWG